MPSGQVHDLDSKYQNKMLSGQGYSMDLILTPSIW